MICVHGKNRHACSSRVTCFSFSHPWSVSPYFCSYSFPWSALHETCSYSWPFFPWIFSSLETCFCPSPSSSSPWTCSSPASPWTCFSLGTCSSSSFPSTCSFPSSPSSSPWSGHARHFRVSARILLTGPSCDDPSPLTCGITK